jgi:hypothetical protein
VSAFGASFRAKHLPEQRAIAHQLRPGGHHVACCEDAVGRESLESNAHVRGDCFAGLLQLGAQLVHAMGEGTALGFLPQRANGIDLRGGLVGQELLHPLAVASGQLRHVVIDDAEHCRVLLEPRDDARRVIRVAGGERGELHFAHALGPGLVRANRNAFDPERRQHLCDVTSQRFVEDDHQHAVRPEAARIAVVEIRQSM